MRDEKRSFGRVEMENRKEKKERENKRDRINH